MKLNSRIRTGIIAGIVAALALTIAGCLQADKRIGMQYDKASDQFTFLVLFNHISSDKLATDGGDPDGDSDYLKTLYANRDHLILLPELMQPMEDSQLPLAPFTSDDFGWLRLSASQFARVSLGAPAGTQPAQSTLGLGTIQIKPGKLFNDGGSNLCYYHQIVVPGKVVDGALDIVAAAEAPIIESALDDEIASRGSGVVTGTWEQLAAAMVAKINSIPEDPAADAPDASPLPDLPHVFSMESLRAMKVAASGGKVDLSRSGSTLTLKMPMSADDAAGIVANWPTVRDAALAKVQGMARKRLALLAADSSAIDPAATARTLAESIGFARNGAGLSVSIDIVAFEQFLSDWGSLNEAGMKKDDRQSRDDLGREMAAAAARKIAVDTDLTVAKVMGDFKGGTLASVPASQPVKPGAGLEIDP